VYIVAKPYVVRYTISKRPRCLLALFEGTVKYTNFALRYKKQIGTGVIDQY